MTTSFDERMTHREARPGMASQRKKIHWAARHSSARVATDWNERYPIGTPVRYQGKLYKTESPAASNAEWEPAVFLDGVEHPVPLVQLDVPEYVEKRLPH